MKILLRIFWQGLLLGLMVQPSKTGEVLCSGTACYTLHFERHSWMEAQRKCEDNGGNLMTVKSQEEASLAWQLLDKMPKEGAGTDVKVRLWIGLHREMGKCYQQHQPLKGFSWVKGGEDTKYSNWEREPLGTCTTKRCVTLQRAPSSFQELAWVDSHCSASAVGMSGYLCKFSFQGMCRPLVLAGPGVARYTTPFGIATASLVAVPLGSTAEVACGPQREEVPNDFLMCKPQSNSNTSEWSSPGPFCASPTLGCSYSNGGCEHECLDLGRGLFQCACHAGYQLAADRLSCVFVDYCSSSPCQGQCLPRPGSFECLCPQGYMLADDGLHCVDVNECSASQSPCGQICVNTMGSFTCLCKPGYKPASPDSQECQDIDECARGMPCEQLCVNTHGSFLCSCYPGYQLEGINSSSCLDVDECLEEPCEHMCINQLGSYQCSCRPGWTLADNEISCVPGVIGRAPFLPTHGEKELRRPANIHPSSETPTLLPQSSIQAELEGSQDFTTHPSVLSTPLGAENQAGDMIDHDSGSSKQLLYYILGGIAILLLLALALSLLTYRKMKAKKSNKKSTSAADNYSWVPDQGETRA